VKIHHLNQTITKKDLPTISIQARKLLGKDQVGEFKIEEQSKLKVSVLLPFLYKGM